MENFGSFSFHFGPYMDCGLHTSAHSWLWALGHQWNPNGIALPGAEKANPALGPVFNCASDRPVTLRELAVACGAACGKTESQVDALIRLYDPKLAKDAPSGGKFPFRATNFDVCVMKAKVVLEWEPEYNDLEELAAGYYLGYKALGLDKSNPKFDRSFDEYILARL